MLLTRSGIAAAALGLVTLALSASPVRAIGGDDTQPAIKINKSTQKCQVTLQKAAGRWAQKRADNIGRCVDSIVKCDEQATPLKAFQCRAKLVKRGVGACATGRLDSGISTLGAGAAAAAASGGSRAKLDRELAKLVRTADGRCSGVELVDPDRGLGFASDPQTAAELADIINADPGGAGCLGNEILRSATPLLDDILQQVIDLHQRCVGFDNPADFLGPCTQDLDCGATSGVCGDVATALREGGGVTIKSCTQ